MEARKCRDHEVCIHTRMQLSQADSPRSRMQVLRRRWYGEAWESTQDVGIIAQPKATSTSHLQHVDADSRALALLSMAC